MKKYNLLNYLEYLRHNPRGYWFKRKLYGWGWVPATREGWFAMLLFIAFVFFDAFFFISRMKNGMPDLGSWFLFFVPLFLGLALLLWVCYKKGEKPGWQWGRRE